MSNSLSFFVAEPDPELLDLIERNLEIEGHRFVGASSFKDALAKIADAKEKRDSFDAVIFDWIFKDEKSPEDALLLLQGLKEISPKITTVSFSWEEAGATDFHARKTDFPSLLEIIKKISAKERAKV